MNDVAAQRLIMACATASGSTSYSPRLMRSTSDASIVVLNT
jgi:hypothetical protein